MMNPLEKKSRVVHPSTMDVTRLNQAELTRNLLMYVKDKQHIDVAQAAKDLNVPINRLYHILSIMEGIEMIEKTGTRKYMVKKGNLSIPAEEQAAKAEEAKALAKRSLNLDAQIETITNALKVSKEDPMNTPHAYVRFRDLVPVPGLGTGKTMVGLSAPNETRFVVERPEGRQYKEYQVRLRTEGGEQMMVLKCPSDRMGYSTALGESGEMMARQGRESTPAVYVPTPRFTRVNKPAVKIHASEKIIPINLDAPENGVRRDVLVVPSPPLDDSYPYANQEVTIGGSQPDQE